MATTINGATNLTPLVATDVIPVERPGNATPYHATLQTMKSYVDNTSPHVMPGVTGDGKWRLMWGENTFYTHKDQVMWLGYNFSNLANNQDDATMPRLAIGMESDFYYDASNHISELYISWLKPAGTTPIRSLHLTWDVATEETRTYHRNDIILWQDAAGTGTFAQAVPTLWTMNVDVTFPTNTDGVILADRSDGHTYRIKVTAGVLGTEQVT